MKMEVVFRKILSGERNCITYRRLREEARPCGASE
jgi:hypothetical protein